MSASTNNPVTVTLTIEVKSNKTNEVATQILVGNAAFLVMDTAESVTASLFGAATAEHLVHMLKGVDQLGEATLKANPRVAMLLSLDHLMDTKCKHESPSTPSIDHTSFTDALDKLFDDDGKYKGKDS